MNTAAIIGIILFLFVLGILWLIIIYNRLIRLRNLKDEAWSGIDVQLKRRYDLIDNLVNSVKGYMGHEKEVLEEIARCRAQAQHAVSVDELSKLEKGLSQALGRLFAVMENYPQLKASENVMQLQQTLTALEQEIQMSRRYYNGTVREFNTQIEIFPANIVARRFNFTTASFFELENASERDVPTVRF